MWGSIQLFFLGIERGYRATGYWCVQVTVTAVVIAHRAGARRGVSSRTRILSTLRNTLLLSLLLGLTWITALLPTSPAQQVN